MRVDRHGAGRARRFDFAEDGGRAVAFEQPRRDAAPLHHLDQPCSVAADVGRIRGDVRQRQQLDELVNDLGFVRLPVGANACGLRLNARPREGGRQHHDQNGERQSFHSHLKNL